MADWLKIRHALVRSAKIYALARELKCKKHAALGVAVSWLVWIDEQTEDGKTHLSPDELADEIGFRGCAEALIAIGWAALGCDGCVEAVEFGKHCGESAKKRAENALRKAKARADSAKMSQEKRDKCHAKTVTNVTQKALPEKNRIEYNNKLASNTEVNMEPPDQPARAIFDANFQRWLAAVCAAHSGLSKCPRLPQDAQEAAVLAYEAAPHAAEHAELLKAYMGSNMALDRYGNKFWRPYKFTEYFATLGEVIEHALRWKRETGWKPAKKAKPSPEASPQIAEAQQADPQEQEAFLRQIDQMLR